MSTYSAPRGPVPKPEAQRRRANKPRSHGAAEPTTAPAAESKPRALGIDDAHPFVEAMWDTVQQSCEAAFYSRGLAAAALGAVVRQPCHEHRHAA